MQHRTVGGELRIHLAQDGRFSVPGRPAEQRRLAAFDRRDDRIDGARAFELHAGDRIAARLEGSLRVRIERSSVRREISGETGSNAVVPQALE